MARRFLSAIKLLTGSTPPAGTAGDTFFDTDTKTIQVHDGTAWVNSSVRPTDGAIGGRVFTGDTSPTSPVVGDLWVDGDTKSAANGSFVRWQIFATAGQTTLSGNDVNGIALSYVVGYEQVYINGALQYRGQDYTATTGTTVTGISDLLDGDVVEVLVLTSIILPAYTSYSSTAPASPAVGQLWVDTSQAVNDTASYVIAATTPISGFRNAIINGDFRISQRGTSFTPSSGAYTCDRWQVVFDGSGATRTVSQFAFTPGNAISGYESPFHLRYAQSVAGTGGTFSGLQQRIEDVRTFAGQTVTVSFWAKADASRSLSPVIEQVYGSGGSSSNGLSLGTASLSTSWQRFTFTTTVPSISGKTVGANSFLQLYFVLPINTTFTIDIWGVQVEPGAIATPFEQRPIGTELALCQRYYVTMGAGSGGSVDSANRVNLAWSFPVTMRTTPGSPTKINEPTIRVNNNTFTATASTIAAFYNSPQGAVITTDGFSGLTAGWGVACVTTTVPVYGFSAEL
jgi:hypothetical protein